MDTISQLLELFPYAIMGSIIAGVICSFLGVFIVSQRVVFLGAVLTQVSIAGVAFSFLHLINIEASVSVLFGDSPFLHHFEAVFFSLVFALITVLIFSQTYRQKILTQDTILGIIFVSAIALRIMFIQKSPVAEVSEIESILKGDILFLGAGEFISLSAIMVMTFLIFVLFRKQLQFVTFDPESAFAHGINSKLWILVFYVVVGIGISLTTRFVGDVFAFAFIIIPSSTGILLAKNVKGVFFISLLIGASVPPTSLLFAFILDFSSGPTAVILAFMIFISAIAIKKIKS